MIIKDIINALEELAPLSYAEDFDNVGLLVGDKNTSVSKALITLDTTEKVVDEAIEKDCNLIISFHPIVFSGIKKFNGQDYVNRTVLKAIKNDIAIYAVHTALDQVKGGVNDRICDQLKLKNSTILIPKKDYIKKLTTYVPTEQADQVREALFEAGAGKIGNYDECSFNTEGTGTFKGDENSNPVIGQKGVTQFEKEIQIGITFEKHLEAAILKALFKSHPYEEVAYEITQLGNRYQNVGMGMIGELEQPINESDFLQLLKREMKAACVRHSDFINKPISRVAVLGGSGSFAIRDAIRAGADAFVTADLKYHQFYQAENKLLLCDIGHYESEQYTKNLLVEFLTKKFINFAFILSDIKTNPINYF
ncbi:MAG: Nif3-like dinuclear metal center hexameric protein [Flavobacteriaceae bacterium]|nr:Nif3-like dinuclear metal center hexameric protein [Flavobacteriaceae bacterium]